MTPIHSLLYSKKLCPLQITQNGMSNNLETVDHHENLQELILTPINPQTGINFDITKKLQRVMMLCYETALTNFFWDVVNIFNLINFFFFVFF